MLKSKVLGNKWILIYTTACINRYMTTLESNTNRYLMSAEVKGIGQQVDSDIHNGLHQQVCDYTGKGKEYQVLKKATEQQGAP